ncbi:AAA family ATPase [Paenibacillus ehimensis]|uniref:ATP-dependent nuclease n=1 Tax=Paenibacillus ehimensis TaxID=79264 RepID=UPI002C855C44|nr:AAA family ATPase [Bacillus sp. (in: firmicutes)]
MYLKYLHIKNFRAIKELKLEFNKGLNILVGENNAGKSAIIDALRICLSYGKQARDIYVRRSDFYIDRSNPDLLLPDIEFHLNFEVEKDEETGWFNDLHALNDNGQSELQIHFRYYIDRQKNIEKIKYRVWGGHNEGQQIEPDVWDLLLFVYLGALRDAEQYLRPSRGNRIGQLYMNLNEDSNKNRIDEDKRKELARKVTDALKNNQEWTDLITTGKEKVNEHLKQTTFHGKGQEVEIDFLPYEFKGIVDNLRMQIPVFNQENLQTDSSKQEYFELYQNGLGYNNLIYTATVLGDLKNRQQVEPETYIALLIEEPEAHLHPQLQNLFFKYLNELDKIGFQLFVTSHSPTITAKADLNALIVVQNQKNNISALSIKNSDLKDENKAFLAKFLDVTKSQLFFANGVIFVEGISEALLLPVFAKLMDKDGKYDLDKNGIEIVNVNGVAFEHFGKLFNSTDEEKRLHARAAIITDSDPKSTGEISERAVKAVAMQQGLLKVQLAKVTFEHDLFLEDKANRDLLLNIYQEMHQRTIIEKGSSDIQHAREFMNKLGTNKDKSELAYRLAVKLEAELFDYRQSEKELANKAHPNDANQGATKINFKVPEYIAQAIKWVVQDDADV